jgi:hypothetical protein
MEWLIALVLVGLLLYLLFDKPSIVSSRKRLCDYYASGTHDVDEAISKGLRLLEVHVYADEQDHPVVAKSPQPPGRDFAEDNVTFEHVCVTLANDAFPSQDPFILSIVPHTDKTIVLNRVAEHLKTTVRKHLVSIDNIHNTPIDSLANKLILVSGSGHITGSTLEPMLNLTWTGSNLRRLTLAEAQRDPIELAQFTRDSIAMLVPDLKPQSAVSHVYGCQWNFYASSPGFVQKKLLED